MAAVGQEQFYYGDWIGRENVIYVILVNHPLVKIGFATSLADRFRECQRWVPNAEVIAAFPATIELEKKLHDWISVDCRVRSEVYDIEKLREKYPTSIRCLSREEERDEELERVVSSFIESLQEKRVYDVSDAPITEPYADLGVSGYSAPPRGSVFHMSVGGRPCLAIDPDGFYWSRGVSGTDQNGHRYSLDDVWMPDGDIHKVEKGKIEWPQ